MNLSSPTLDEELLSAWVDGELDAQGPERERLQALLERDPEAAARANAWSADAQALREAFAPMLAEPVPPALARRVWKRRAAPRWALAAAAAGLLLVGGLVGGAIGLGWQAGQAQAEAGAAAGGWVARAVYAHAVYTAERRHPVEVRADEEHLSRWLTARTEVPVRLVDLGPQGFTLLGGRLLPDGLGKSAQLMYQNAAGARVTVYLRKPEGGSDHALRFEPHGDLNVLHWVEDGIGCAIVGAVPRAELERMADAIYRQTEAAAAAGTAS